MDILGEVSSVAAVVLGLMAGAYFGVGSRDKALWATYAAIVVALTSGFAFAQDRLWKTDSEATSKPKKSESDSLDLRYTGSAAQLWPYAKEPFYTHVYIVQDATIVNHSERNMSLRFMLLTRLKKKNGERSGAINGGEWKFGGMLEDATSVDTLNIPKDSTVRGTLIFKLSGLKVPGYYEIEDWEKVGSDKFAIRVEDLVTRRIVFFGVYRYPPEYPFADIE
jgi:hypothetical protein